MDLTIMEVGVMTSIAGSAVAVWRSLVGSSEKRMQEIAEKVMNPALQQERYEQMKQTLEEIKVMLANQPQQIREATIAGVRAGVRLEIKKRDTVDEALGS